MRRCPDLARFEERRKRLQVFRRVVAVAASLIVGISILLVYSLLKPESSRDSVGELVSSAAEPSIKVEMVSPNGRIEIPAGEQVASVDSLKTLVIDDKHRMVMDAGTSLSVRPLTADGRLGCTVNLSQGRIHAHVEHDGNPFVVATAHGRAIITGTTFDVKATDNNTALVVADGSVRFESGKGAVDVETGQISEIAGNSAPTRPVPCNTAELTAWATAYELKPALAKIQSISHDYDLADLWLSATSGTPELAAIDYEDWIEEKRPWFKREFPQIFQLQEALAKEGIDTDYPDLLLLSGDIWQFVYPEASHQQISILRVDSLLKTASRYGFDERWLLDNIPSVKSEIGNSPDATGRFIGQEAFEHWADCFEQLRKSQKPSDSGTLLYSLHASVYLANTRTLVWLSLMNGKIDVPQVDKAGVMALLETEVNTANGLTGRVIRLFALSGELPCDESRRLLDGVVEDIRKIADVEKGILENEARK
jgi:hypothetical protein